ncbi:MAG: hypothetical protein VX999_04120 [Candidatus Thermoplasmatota archaeon]|nr:hypothetical protein [Candidatus Thermoplasmatota archaeon]
MVKPIECASTPTFEAASAMSDTPPPPSGLPPPPPPPLPPGFGVDDEEDEFSDVIEEEMDVESEEEIVSELQDELPPPPPPGFDPLHRSFTGFDSSPPSPPEFDDADEEEEEVWDVDELDIQSFDDTLTSLEQMPEAEEDGVEEAEEEVEDWNAALDRAFVTEAEEDSKGSSEEVSQIALSSNLRPAAEVDSIPGDKLYVTLREKEESVLNPDGTVRQQSIDGELILRNSSRKDRAWDIEVLLQNTDSTDIGGGAITVRELDATQTTNLPYTASGPRMLILREHIDTEPERPQESSLSMIFSEHSQEILIRLSVENIAPVSLTDVVVRRALPENFELVDGPEYDIKDNELVWRIGRLPVGESASLEILPRVTTRTIQRFATGTVSATYSCEATVSRAQFDSVNSRARQFGYVSPKEDDRPDVFHCKLVVENRSSFVVGLSGATVWLAGRSEPFLDMEDIREDIPPEGLWDSIEKRIEAIDKPNFTHEINYSILPRANVESTGILELKERSFKVLDAEVNKQYSISRIRSYVASDLDCITVVENTGSAPINVMRLLDDIPGIFNIPSSNQVRIEMEGTDLNEDQYRIEVVDGTQLEEQLVSPDSQGHALRITVGTSAPLGLQPGKSLTISYPLHADDPSPQNDKLAAPIRADFSMERFGPVATRYCNRAPLIRVVHRRRRFSTGKEVFPAAGPGRYEILLMFQNDSDSALEDLSLHDVVPGTFNIEKSTVRSNHSGERVVDFSKESAREGTHVTWPIGRIEKDERIEVVFEIQGDSESEYKVADAQDYHGATFGDEVDEEPNLPDWADESTRSFSEISEIEPESELDLVELEVEEQDELEEESDSDMTVDLSVPQVQNFEVEPEEEVEEKSEESDEEEEEPQQPAVITPDVCPVCGSEASVGASSCETCSFQFS